jgi:hypothetical protein
MSRFRRQKKHESLEDYNTALAKYKEIQSEYNKKYFKENREKLLEYKKTHKQDFRKSAERIKAYYKKNYKQIRILKVDYNKIVQNKSDLSVPQFVEANIHLMK